MIPRTQKGRKGGKKGRWKRRLSIVSQLPSFFTDCTLAVRTRPACILKIMICTAPLMPSTELQSQKWYSFGDDFPSFQDWLVCWRLALVD